MVDRRSKLTPSARRDIAEIAAHSLRTFGTAQYERYRSLMIQAVRVIGEDPFGAGTRSMAAVAPGLRALHLRSLAGRRTAARHFVIYRVDADGTVWILRLLHDSMDIPHHLAAEQRDLAEPD